MNKRVDFCLKTKKFITFDVAKNPLPSSASVDSVPQFTISDTAFKAISYPYHDKIFEFQENPLNLQYNLELAIYNIEFPEDFLIKIGDLFHLLNGDTITCTIFGEKPHFDQKKYVDFASMILSIKYLWSKMFGKKFAKFCMKNGVDIKGLSMEISVQRWGNCKDIYRATNDNYGNLNVRQLKSKNREVNDDLISKIKDCFSEKAILMDFAILEDGRMLCFRKLERKTKPLDSSFAKFKSKEFCRIAVVGMVFCDDKFLLLKQSDDLKLWKPPCGGVRRGEDCIEALKREIKEDSGLDVDVVLPVNIWKNSRGIDGRVLSITYACKAKSMDVKISKEYSQFLWIENPNSFKGKTTFDISHWKHFLKVAISFTAAITS